MGREPRDRNLSSVKLVLPWSTPALRFCTSELKSDVITSALKKRYPRLPVVSVNGVRREESTARSRKPVTAALIKLTRRGLPGITWNAIIEWKAQDVMAAISASGLALHEAYTIYGNTRVSCVFCIMSSEHDLRAAAGCADKEAVYAQMVDLECDSTFAFQGGRWLADVAPDLLTASQHARIAIAKAASAREAAESRLPRHLLHGPGWPSEIPSDADAALIAAVRRDAAAALGIEVGVTTAGDVQARYADLIGKRSATPARGVIPVIAV